MITSIQSACSHLATARTTTDPRIRMLSILLAEDVLLKEHALATNPVEILAEDVLLKEHALATSPVEILACENCDYEGKAGDHRLDEVCDLYSRIEPGDTVPYGQCPKCGSLLHPKRPS